MSCHSYLQKKKVLGTSCPKLVLGLLSHLGQQCIEISLHSMKLRKLSLENISGIPIKLFASPVIHGHKKNSKASWFLLLITLIQSGGLRKKILSFVLVDGHKGDEIGKALDKLLIDWGTDRVCTITVDNASSNDTCLAYMKRSLTNRGCTLARGQHLHMRCVAHIVNLVVQDGLKIMCHPVNRIRNAIKYVRASPMRLKVFKKCVELSKVDSKGLLNVDVSTRWNSTFVMLNTAEKLERAFEQYALHDPNYKTELEKFGPGPKAGSGSPDERGPPTYDDWVYIREFKEFLQHFYDLTNKVSSTKYITANTFLEEIAAVNFLLGEWSDRVICGDDIIFKNMATKMKDKYEKYWGDPEKMN